MKKHQVENLVALSLFFNMCLWSEHYLPVLLFYAVESIMIVFGVPVGYSGVNTLSDSSTMVKRRPIQREKVFSS
jgi:hypothetical protein